MRQLSGGTRRFCSSAAVPPPALAACARESRTVPLNRRVKSIRPLAAERRSFIRAYKVDDWHTKRLFENIRANLIFDNMEHMRSLPAKKGGRKLLGGRLKYRILDQFYSDNDDRVIYNMTRKRKAQMQGITPLEQQTTFTYRRRKFGYWKLKTQIQMGKKRLASSLNKVSRNGHPEWMPPYKYSSKFTDKVWEAKKEE